MPSPRTSDAISTLSLHQKLAELSRGIRGLEVHLAELLAEMEERKGFEEFATHSIEEYAKKFLGLQRGKGSSLTRIGRRLHELPRLKEAMTEGRVPWTKAREVVRVAETETEEEWVERAERWTNRQLERAVRRVLDETEPEDDPPAPPEDPPAAEKVVYRFELDPEQARLLESALTLVRASSGEADDDAKDERRPGLTEAEVLTLLAEKVIAGAAPDLQVKAERFQVVIRRCSDCDRAELAGLPGDEVGAVTDDQIARAACDGIWVSMLPGEEGRTNKTVTDSVRRVVLERDNYQCAVPNCTNRHWIDLHHVVPQEVKGPHSVNNLVCLCSGHHRMVHKGKLHVEMDNFAYPVFDWPRVHAGGGLHVLTAIHTTWCEAQARRRRASPRTPWCEALAPVPAAPTPTTWC